MVGSPKPTLFCLRSFRNRMRRSSWRHENVERIRRLAMLCLDYARQRASPSEIRLDARKPSRSLWERSGEHFFLDIPSHRTSPLIGLIELIATYPSTWMKSRPSSNIPHRLASGDHLSEMRTMQKGTTVSDHLLVAGDPRHICRSVKLVPFLGIDRE